MLSAHRRTAQFTRPRSNSRANASSCGRIIAMMNMARSEAGLDEIEAVFAADQFIASRLMAQVNSVGMGFPRQVSSIQQAIRIFGYRGLYRWLAMLLVTAGPRAGNSGPGRAALIRGRFLELIGRSPSDAGRSDDLFVLGTASLLDRVIGKSMEDLLCELSVSPQMGRALLWREGIYGQYLLLAEAMESGEEDQVDEFCAKLAVHPYDVTQLHALATKWTDAMAAA